MRDRPLAKPVPARDAAKLGRHFATALYWIVVAYATAAGFISVVPQVFWPAEAYRVPAETPPNGCGAAFRELHGDLLRLTETRHDPTSNPLAPFLRPWDERYRALESSCGHLHSYTLLSRLRYRLEEDLLRFDTELAPLSAATLRAIDAGE